ncbi:diguanylate cyclase [Pelosinus sp. sgz500959]|uniref:sensor domain-containing diguanylate cyclase n=1 Tax=Pelosinus sp. sgz500959 TaxID=3242472 RepID=UPI0036720B7D
MERICQPAEYYREIVNQARDIILIMYMDGRIIDVNQAALKAYGYSQAEFATLTVGDLRHPSVQRSTSQRMKVAVTDGIIVETIHRRKDGSFFLVEANSYRISIGTEDRLVTMIRDITQRIEEKEEQFRSLFSNMAEGVALHELIYDDVGQPCNYRIIEVNPSYERTLGIQRDHIVDQLATNVYQVEEPPYLKEYSEVVHTHSTINMETYFSTLDKYFTISIVPWGKNGFATIASDITEIKNAQQELLAKNAALEELASTDRLTGIWNRRYFEKTTKNEMDRAKRYRHPISLVMFDIDRFKKINDNYGHHAGDQILINVSRLIQDKIRASDSLARWGGDEFIILLPTLSGNHAMKLSEKIRIFIADHEFPDVGFITLSMGVAELRPDENIWSWINRADDALYVAKVNGRNRVSLSTLNEKSNDQ